MLQPIILQAIGWQALHASAIIVIEPEVNLFQTSLALGFGFEGRASFCYARARDRLSRDNSGEMFGCSPAPRA